MTTDFTAEHLPLLTRRQRQAVQARLDGLGLKETAAKLGMAYATIRVTMRAARRRAGLPDGRSVARDGGAYPQPQSYVGVFKPEHLPLVSPRVRPVVELAMTGKTAREIAAALSLSEGTVYGRLNRAQVAIARAASAGKGRSPGEIAALETALLEALKGGETVADAAKRLAIPITSARRRVEALEKRLGVHLYEHRGMDDDALDGYCRCGESLGDDAGSHECFKKAATPKWSALDFMRTGTSNLGEAGK